MLLGYFRSVVMLILDFLYETKVSSSTISKLYKFFPFNRDTGLQFPGNVIQYVFIELAKIKTSECYNGYSSEEWWLYKELLFGKLCELIEVNGVEIFTAKECATSLHRMAKMLTSDLKKSEKLPSRVVPQINKLLSRLHNLRDFANAQNLSNTLLSVAKLVASGHLDTVDTTLIHKLLSQLSSLRVPANAQGLSNTLWSVAKLVESEHLKTVDTTLIHELLTQLRGLLVHANAQELSNTLWSVAKLVESGHLKTVDTTLIHKLLTQLSKLRARAKPQELSNTLWASGIINTVISVAVPEELVRLSVDSVKKSGTILLRHQVITGLALLGLLEEYDVTALITACRPISKLQNHEITPHIKGAQSFQEEAFVYGFFVDLVVEFPDGKKKIIEFDGPSHQHSKQQRFDAFRDGILSAQGFEIIRIQNYWNKEKSTIKMTPLFVKNSAEVAFFKAPTLAADAEQITKSSHAMRRH